MSSSLLSKVDLLKEGLTATATGGSFGQSGYGDDGPSYKELRFSLMKNDTSRNLMPDFVIECRSVDEFWSWIKSETSTYAERRELLRKSFAPLVVELENIELAQASNLVSTNLQVDGLADVNTYWEKANVRVQNDPEGALTMARTLLEATCKAILDKSPNTTYSSKDDLPALWRKCATLLNLSPSQHHEEVFKSILGNCTSIVSNISALRNKLGDAHVDGRSPVRPSSRHASLAVNLAGSMATFLVETWQAKSTK